MKIKWIQVGKTTENYLLEGINEYLKRLQHYTTLELITIPDLKSRANLAKEVIKFQEGQLILKHILPTDFVVLLDENGKNYTSVQFSEWLNQQQLIGLKNIVFIIGGAYGFDEQVYKKSNFKISLSLMTFSHQMVRLFFLEQLYRAFTIIKNEKYHHE